MDVRDYIQVRIKSIKDADRTQHDGIYREETKEQRRARISELNNLLDVMRSGTVITEYQRGYENGQQLPF